LAQILSENRGITEAKAEEIVKNMRAANQYQVSLSTRSDSIPQTLTFIHRRTSGHRSNGRRREQGLMGRMHGTEIEESVALFGRDCRTLSICWETSGQFYMVR
jgi:hypothetical protein